MSLHLRPQYGHVTPSSGYPVLTAVNSPKVRFIGAWILSIAVCLTLNNIVFKVYDLWILL